MSMRASLWTFGEHDRKNRITGWTRGYNRSTLRISLNVWQYSEVKSWMETACNRSSKKEPLSE